MKEQNKMKKLMIAAVAVAMGVAANAASVNWAQTADAFGDGAGSELGSGYNAYLIRTSDHSQSAFLEAYANAASLAAFETTVKSWKIDDAKTNGSSMLNKQNGPIGALTAGNAESAYFAIFGEDKVFISKTKTPYSYDSVNTIYTFNFGGSDYDTADASWEGVMDAKGGLQGSYGGAGWYNVAAVPEPTSGLLLLLGVAGLALRRRRA